MTNEASVLEFLEDQETKRHPPAKVTVNRTTQSKYQFYLVVRHYRKRVRPRPQFFTYNKTEATSVKGLIEEHSVFDEHGAFYVLEGFDRRFVESLSPAPNNYVLAETDDGEYKTLPYNFYSQRRNILKVLHAQIGLAYSRGDKPPLTLSALLKLDWSMMRSYEEYEPILRKAKIMAWGPEELEKILEGKSAGNLVGLMKRGNNKELLSIASQLGYSTFYTYLQSNLADLVHYRALRVMGYDEKKCEREMDLSWKRAQDLEEVNKMMTQEDLAKLVNWVIDTDHLQERSEACHIPILIGRNPIQIRR